VPADRSVAVTGAGGFIGRNLVVRLAEWGIQVAPITREMPWADARIALAQASVVFHLAGANRPLDPAEFWLDNCDYAGLVAEAIMEGSQCPLVIVASSVTATNDSEYGRSKRAGEDRMVALAGAARVAIWRLPNVFGKWARPDYNSAVATFCHNCARGLPIHIDDPLATLTLLHIDDLIGQWLSAIDDPAPAIGFVEPGAVHHTTVGAVADMIAGFARDRRAGRVGEVGFGLARALYATFVAALPVTDFAYPLTAHVDARGSFAEVLRTPGSGQISTLTAHPGVTRGGHYHHAKVEKFLVVHGTARFRFRDIATGIHCQIDASADQPLMVETIPGWTHDITNVGDDLLVALVWASECFDPAQPDTIVMPL
jgi:UDP-2-acetamido-2,6-beta-L-arabino-hexul-4-ose reductase